MYQKINNAKTNEGLNEFCCFRTSFIVFKLECSTDLYKRTRFLEQENIKFNEVV